MVRELLVTNLLLWLPGDEGALAVGILLGGGGELSFPTKQAFTQAGMLHVVAASGYNVTVVAGWMTTVLVKWWGRKWGLVGAVLGVLGYMGLAGWSASVVRAGIMTMLTLAGLVLGRKTHAGWILALTVVGMLLLRPGYLQEVGWQLSVTATAGLIWIQPKLARYWAGGGWWGDDLRTSLAAQIATLPIIWVNFHQMNPLAPIINACLLWMVPLVMQVTAAASLVGWVIPTLGRWISYLAWPFLKLMTGVVTLLYD